MLQLHTEQSLRGPLRPRNRSKEIKLVKTDSSQFFSVPDHLILVGIGLPYDLYVNSSTREGRDRFVKIYPKGQSLEKDYLKGLKAKYYTLYIPEFHRSSYLKSLMSNFTMADVERVDVIKDSAIHYLDKLFEQGKEFNTEILAETLNGCRDSVECMVDVIQDYDITELQKLIGSLSFHDFYTYDHSINVAMYCIAIFKALKPRASRYELVQAGLGGLLHDIGKVKVSTSIINKTGALTEEEFGEIKKHPEQGVLLLEEVRDQCPGIEFSVIERVVLEHHENWDGTGYPKKIAGDKIHLLARICCVADFFDAVTTKRSYAAVLSIQEAVNVMSRTVGKKVDPFIFKIFQRVVKKFVQTNKVTKEMAATFDPERPFDELPLVDIAQAPEEKPSTRVTFMDHKKKKPAYDQSGGGNEKITIGDHQKKKTG